MSRAGQWDVWNYSWVSLTGHLQEEQSPFLATRPYAWSVRTLRRATMGGKSEERGGGLLKHRGIPEQTPVST